MNKVIISGNLTKDAEIIDLQNGEILAKDTIAVKREFKNKEGNYDVDFVDIIAYSHTAQYMKNYATKGARAEACGRLQIREYETQEGQKRRVAEVVVESLSIFNGEKKETPEKPEIKPMQVDDEELPF